LTDAQTRGLPRSNSHLCFNSIRNAHLSAASSILGPRLCLLVDFTGRFDQLPASARIVVYV
jgi:hypothetical protein